MAQGASPCPQDHGSGQRRGERIGQRDQAVRRGQGAAGIGDRQLLRLRRELKKNLLGRAGVPDARNAIVLRQGEQFGQQGRSVLGRFGHVILRSRTTVTPADVRRRRSYVPGAT